MYSLRNILKQQPHSIRAAAIAVLAALVITDVVHLSGEATAAWGVVIDNVLTLLYVKPLTVTTSALNELEDT